MNTGVPLPSHPGMPAEIILKNNNLPDNYIRNYLFKQFLILLVLILAGFLASNPRGFLSFIYNGEIRKDYYQALPLGRISIVRLLEGLLLKELLKSMPSTVIVISVKII